MPPTDATPPNFAIKTFANGHKTLKFAKVFSLKGFLLYDTVYLLVLLQLGKRGIHCTFASVLFSCITQVDIPTTIGVGPGMVVAMETDKDPTPTTEKKYYIDPTFLYTPREGVEMVSPLKDGLSKLWKERS